ncbi:hypothetical protein ACFZCL_29085 [Streptomyces sp. NPDC008159]|uniref:hypothetical protein n=1 Tax=Streptomyces sp. NPDC008159 TaxID=3364817 RepID=UPI0036EB6D0A
MTSPQPQTQQEQQAVPGEARTTTDEQQTGGKVLHLHTAHPRVPIPYVTPGDMFSGTRRATSSVASTATSLLPSTRKLAFYGLLGGMTVAGAMAWPVAVAVGAATEVITREQAASRQREGQGAAGPERVGSEQDRPSGADSTPAPTSATTPGQTATT